MPAFHNCEGERDCDYPDEYDDAIDGWGDDDGEDRSMFTDPGGTSALRAATEDNPRNLPCPRCGTEDVLTPADKRLGYVCDDCANRAERGYD